MSGSVEQNEKPDDGEETAAPAADLQQTDLESVSGGCHDFPDGGTRLPDWITPTLPETQY